MSDKIREHRLSDFTVNILGLMVTLLVAFIVVIILIFLLSKQPLNTIYYFFIGPFTNKYYFGNMINSSVPLMFTGLGIAVAFKSSVFNLGGEGQVYASALVATALAIALPHISGFIGVLVASFAAGLTGAVLAGLSGYFKMKWNTDELISSYLISAAVILIVNYFITGPLNDPTNSLLATRAVEKQYFLARIFPPSKLNTSLFFAIITAGLVFFLMYHTHWGYEMRICGLNREFAKYGGINTAKYLVLPMLLSGFLHGLAGSMSIFGTYHRCIKTFSFGMGWNGIAVALIAKNNPIAVIPSALFFAYIQAGANAAMIHSDITYEIVAIVQAVIFFLITAEAIYNYFRYKPSKRRIKEEEAK